VLLLEHKTDDRHFPTISDAVVIPSQIVNTEVTTQLILKVPRRPRRPINRRLRQIRHARIPNVEEVGGGTATRIAVQRIR
jgi:hypothetical protein